MYRTTSQGTSPMFRSLSRPCRALYESTLYTKNNVLKFFPLGSEEPITDLEKYIEVWRKWRLGE